MSGSTSAVTIARLPRRGFIPFFLVAVMILGPGLFSPEFSVLWLLRGLAVILILWRITQVRLVVDQESVIVNNFLRRIQIPLIELVIPAAQSTPGYLELETRTGQSFSVGAVPSWGADLDEVSSRLRDVVDIRLAERYQG